MGNHKGAKRVLSLALVLILTVGLIWQNQSAIFMAKEGPEETEEEQWAVADLSGHVFQEGGTAESAKTGFRSYSARTNTAGAQEALLAAIRNWSTAPVDLSAYSIPASEMNDLLADLTNKNPEVFYLKLRGEGGTGYSYNPKTKLVTSCSPVYDPAYTQADLAKYRAARAAAYAEAVTDENMTDIQKALALHDYLAQHMEYDESRQKHNAYNALVEKTAVCQGYTLAYADLLKMAGIEVDFCESDAMEHIWNYVKIDNNWYHVDVTWDDPVKDQVGYVRHKYFMVSDSKMNSEGTGPNAHHHWTAKQNCSSTIYDNYYWQNDLSAIFYIDGSNYYIKTVVDGTNRATGFYRNNAAWNAEEKLFAIPDEWNVWGSSQIYVANYSALSYYGGKLYYNGTKDIYEVVPAVGNPQKIYTYTGTDGYLYGSLACGDKVTLGVSKAYDVAPVRSEVAFPEETIKSLSVTASPAQLTCGYTSGAVLTATLVKGNGVSGTPTYQWYTVSTDSSGAEKETLILGQAGSAYTYTMETGLGAGSYKYRIKAILNGKVKAADVTVTVQKQNDSISNGSDVRSIGFFVGNENASFANAVSIKSNPRYGDDWSQILTIGKLTAKVGSDADSDGTHFTLDVSGKPGAGTYTVKVLYSGTLGGKTYTATEVCGGTVTVAKRTISVAAGTYKVSKVYDGTLDAGDFSGEILKGGILPADKTAGVEVVVTPAAYTNANAGGQSTMEVTLALVGDASGNYELKQTTLTVPCEIRKKPILPTVEVTGEYAFTGNAIVPSVVVKEGDTVLVKGSDYTVLAKDNIHAGTAKVDVAAAETGNYTWTTVTKSFVIAKVPYTGTTELASDGKYGNRVNCDLTGYLPHGFVVGAISTEDGDEILTGVPVVDDKVLFYTFAADPAKADKTAVIRIPVTESTDYEEFVLEVTVTLLDKLFQMEFGFADEEVEMTYGDAAFSVAAWGAAAGATVVYSSSDETIATVDAAGKVQAKKPGRVVITAVSSETEDYKAAESSCTLTIAKKPLKWDVSRLEAVDKEGHVVDQRATLFGVLLLSGILDGDKEDAIFACDAKMLKGTYESEKAGIRKVTLEWAGEEPAALQGEKASYYVMPEALPEIMGKINKVEEEVNVSAGTDANSRYKIEKEDGISSVPEAFKDMDGLNTPSEIEGKMRAEIGKRAETIKAGNMAVYDMVLLVDSDGAGWVEATKDNFPTGGLTITLPYPKGTAMDTHDFVAAHLFTTDMGEYKAGDVEYPEVTKVQNGITFTVHGLSPVSIGWKDVEKAAEPAETENPETSTNPSPGEPSKPGSGSQSTGDGVNTRDVNDLGLAVGYLLLGIGVFVWSGIFVLGERREKRSKR